MEDPSNIPGFWKSLFLWAVNSVISTTHFLAMLAVRPFSRQLCIKILKEWSRRVAKLANIEVKVKDESNGNWGSPPFLFVLLNQNSLAEVTVYYQVFPPPLRMIINIEFAALPFIGWAYTLIGSIVIVRQWKKQAKRGIERAQQLMKDGENIGISIEGRRSPDGKVSSYKKGPAVLAIGAGATIVPLVFHGARSVYPPGTWRVQTGTIELEICRPIDTRGLSYEDRNEIVEKMLTIAKEKVEAL